MAGQMERMQVFVAVAQRQSFASAARDLQLSRSIVTRYVSELEAELGVQLLIRTTRKVSLSTAGRLYLTRIAPLLEELGRARDLVFGQQEGLSGDLRISVPVSFGQRFLPDILYPFYQAHPDVSLKVDMTDRFVDLMEEGYDMALRISGPPDGVSHIWRKIAKVPRLLFAAPSYLERAGPIVEPKDLQQHDFLGYSHFASGRSLQLQHQQSGQQVSVHMDYALECNSGEVLVALACKGCGIALTPLFMASDALKKGQLVPLLKDWVAPDIWLTAYYPPYDKLPAKVAAFSRFVEDRLASGHDFLC
ncbi:MAG: LysR family transcriptional regulator [Cohaesibacter sp.]|nr:LysR family transcriptional regulator [Cohaesibacter sp.]MCV6601324.1 LysR family transcriptional regulator [Cohaesibacter sp.]